MSLLDMVLHLPLLGFLVLLFVPKASARMVALVISLVIFGMSLGLLGPFMGGGDAERVGVRA